MYGSWGYFHYLGIIIALLTSIEIAILGLCNLKSCQDITQNLKRERTAKEQRRLWGIVLISLTPWFLLAFGMMSYLTTMGSGGYLWTVLQVVSIAMVVLVFALLIGGVIFLISSLFNRFNKNVVSERTLKYTAAGFACIVSLLVLVVVIWFYPISIKVTTLPYKRTFKLANGNSLYFTLPSGKTVALWAERDEGGNEQDTKSHLSCSWGEKPFRNPVSIAEHVPNGPTIYSGKYDSYIQDHGVCSYDGVSAYKLSIEDINFTYIQDHDSTPQLAVTIQIERVATNSSPAKP